MASGSEDDCMRRALATVVQGYGDLIVACRVMLTCRSLFETIPGNLPYRAAAKRTLKGLIPQSSTHDPFRRPHPSVTAVVWSWDRPLTPVQDPFLDLMFWKYCWLGVTWDMSSLPLHDLGLLLKPESEDASTHHGSEQQQQLSAFQRAAARAKEDMDSGEPEYVYDHDYDRSHSYYWDPRGQEPEMATQRPQLQQQQQEQAHQPQQRRRRRQQQEPAQKHGDPHDHHHSHQLRHHHAHPHCVFYRQSKQGRRRPCHTAEGPAGATTETATRHWLKDARGSAAKTLSLFVAPHPPEDSGECEAHLAGLRRGCCRRLHVQFCEDLDAASAARLLLRADEVGAKYLYIEMDTTTHTLGEGLQAALSRIRGNVRGLVTSSSLAADVVQAPAAPASSASAPATHWAEPTAEAAGREEGVRGGEGGAQEVATAGGDEGVPDRRGSAGAVDDRGDRGQPEAAQQQQVLRREEAGHAVGGGKEGEGGSKRRLLEYLVYRMSLHETRTITISSVQNAVVVADGWRSYNGQAHNVGVMSVFTPSATGTWHRIAHVGTVRFDLKQRVLVENLCDVDRVEVLGGSSLAVGTVSNIHELRAENAGEIDLQAMAHTLRFLSVKESKLTVLPAFPHLHRLVLQDMPTLGHIAPLKSLHTADVRNCKALESLLVLEPARLVYLQQLPQLCTVDLRSADRVYILQCPKLTSLASLSTPSLVVLEIGTPNTAPMSSSTLPWKRTAEERKPRAEERKLRAERRGKRKQVEQGQAKKKAKIEDGPAKEEDDDDDDEEGVEQLQQPQQHRLELGRVMLDLSPLMRAAEVRLKLHERVDLTPIAAHPCLHLHLVGLSDVASMLPHMPNLKSLHLERCTAPDLHALCEHLPQLRCTRVFNSSVLSPKPRPLGKGVAMRGAASTGGDGAAGSAAGRGKGAVEGGSGGILRLPRSVGKLVLDRCLDVKRMHVANVDTVVVHGCVCLQRCAFQCVCSAKLSLLNSLTDISAAGKSAPHAHLVVERCFCIRTSAKTLHTMFPGGVTTKHCTLPTNT